MSQNYCSRRFAPGPNSPNPSNSHCTTPNQPATVAARQPNPTTMRGHLRRHQVITASTSGQWDSNDPTTISEESAEEQELSSSLSGSESDGDDDAERQLERMLADVPFGELQRVRSDGSLAARAATSAVAAAIAQKKARREHKKRPMEMSTKVRPPRFRDVIQAPKKVLRDPRFESIHGTVDKEGFRKRYNFLFDVEFPAEKERLQNMIKKSKDPKAVEELKSRISWIDKQLKSHPRKNIESEILHEHIKKEREAAKSGKRPYYLKKSEIRQRKFMNKYNELKEAGKVDLFIEKRRRKNASKDHRYMPYRRSGDGAE